MKVFVIPGHGAGDPGACGGGYSEAERVRALARRIKAYGGDSVILADFSRNYYADNGISSLGLPTSTQIVELHMDSGADSARGGHVIVQAGMGTDKYDRAIAAEIARIFPGRAITLVERNDLANPARAAARGYGSRWRRLSRAFLRAHPLCAACQREGRYVKATVVDHIKPHRGDPVLFWDQDNWQPLCKHHHDVKTRTEDQFPEYHY